MFSMPGPAAAEWLNKLLLSLVSPERCREVFRTSNQFSDPAFLASVERLSREIDNLIFEISFLSDFPEMRLVLAGAPKDVVDGFIARTFLTMNCVENEPSVSFDQAHPDILSAMRQLLIRDSSIRSGGGTSH